jgi:hypothetical protein
LGLRTWYFNSNKHECMRAETLGIYLLKYLHHSELNWVMVNSDIQVLINLRILKNDLGMLNSRQSVRLKEHHPLIEPKVAPLVVMVSDQAVPGPLLG